jgi:NADPH:quinone reductase-like Zn-dependent oxidoreductase
MPVPHYGEVLVRVAGSGVNPVDAKIRSGQMQGAYHVDFPHVVGREFSGTIERVESGVSEYEVGDAIYGIDAKGTCAEYIVTRPDSFAVAPRNIDLPEAGAVPLAGMTAWQGLLDFGGIQYGQRVLIHAGGGGVGTFAIQLAKWSGCYVYSTVSSDQIDTARELGADRPIDYRREEFESVAHDVDIVFDLLGGEIGERSLACLKPGGVLISTVHDAPTEEAARQGKRAINMTMKPSSYQLDELRALIERGDLNPVIESIVPFDEAIEAQMHVEEGHTHGKVVVDVRQ